jgi:hypothetical protein
MSATHEPAGAAMYPAILRLMGDSASARAEHSRSFSVKKKQEYHAAAGESGFHRVIPKWG